MNFFDPILRLSYSRDLHQYLKGLSDDCNSYSGSSVYQATGIVMWVICLVVMANYYYAYFNNPRFTRRWVWLLNILAACCIVGGFAYARASAGLPEDRHCRDLHFSGIDCFLFAVTEMLWTFMLCILFSLLFKWRSVANKKIPF